MTSEQFMQEGTTQRNHITNNINRYTITNSSRIPMTTSVLNTTTSCQTYNNIGGEHDPQLSFTSLLSSDIQFHPMTCQHQKTNSALDSDLVRISVSDQRNRCDVTHKYSINSCSRPVLYNVNDVEVKQEYKIRHACTKVWRPKPNTITRKSMRYVVHIECMEAQKYEISYSRLIK